jgi:hypothetical protein
VRTGRYDHTIYLARSSNALALGAENYITEHEGSRFNYSGQDSSQTNSRFMCTEPIQLIPNDVMFSEQFRKFTPLLVFSEMLVRASFNQIIKPKKHACNFAIKERYRKILQKPAYLQTLHSLLRT